MKKKKMKIRLWEENVSAFCFVIMFILLTLGFISRIFAGFSFAFAEEIVVQLFLCLTMFSVSSCLIRGLHMGMSVLTDMLGKRAKRAAVLFIFIISVLMFSFLGWQGLAMVKSQYQYHLVTPILLMPQWIFTLCIPVGSALFIIRSVQKLINDFREEEDG